MLGFCFVSLDIYKECQIAKINFVQRNQIISEIQEKVQAGEGDIDLTNEMLGRCYKNGHIKNILYMYMFLTVTEDPQNDSNKLNAFYFGSDTIVRTGDFSYENWSYFKKE